MDGFFEVSVAARRRARIRAGLPADPPGGFDAVATVIDHLPDPGCLCAEERAAAMSATATALNRIQAYLSDLAGAADSHGDARVLRAGTTSTLLAAATGSTPAVASSIVHTATGLRDLPEVAAAYRAGAISGMHVRAILDHTPHISQFHHLETAVVHAATTTDPREVGRILQLIADNDTDGDHTTLTYTTQRARRSARLSSCANGMWRLTALLDETTGAILADALAAATAPIDDTGDTLTQRRADALTDLIYAGTTTTRPLGVSAVSILIDVEHLPDGSGARLPDGTPILPATFEYYACAATCAIVFGVHRNDTFLPLTLGRTTRRATAAQWAALIARDRGCIRCGRAPRYCQAHHIHHWQHGGSTDLPNLALMCSRCHHDLHHGHYTITVDSHGTPIITPTRPPPRHPA